MCKLPPRYDKSPIILPCGHSICKSHSNNAKGHVICNSCGIEHPLPSKTASKQGGFPLNEALARITQVEIGSLDFGETHKEAMKSCAQLEKLLDSIESVLKEPTNFTNEAIGSLECVVQLKGEEMKMKIDEQMNQMFVKLNEYKNECKKKCD
jgi:hypothetical protein